MTRPARFLNAHFLNPAYLIPLVELSPAKETSAANLAALKSLLESAGKVVVRCAPSPGYIVPRLQAAAMNEAARMVEEGVATPEDIDRAVRAGFGPRYTAMGLCEFIDYGGLDILYYASSAMARALDAIVFDYNGTLVDDLDLAVDSYHRAGLERGHRLSRETVLRHISSPPA